MERRPAAEADRPREPTASVRDIERGAILHFAPSAFDQLADVQANVMDYAQRLAGGECPLLRDDLSLLPAHARRINEPYAVPMPAGIIPGVGSIPTTTAIPSIGASF
jgi:hypothetical protein